ncbi:ParB/RepB/Spo0J family partition protein [Brachybacterium sp. FME24]|uniref:ParB/RepB/Spo0J family partition protein n=1 Tax=Brachybacterium sp. FME24 TaxID=2742605 RepID=UPI0018677254|nr:ParB/RepB/Spo0J family partition protein [Brachybacterium sp. FME24]
MTQKRGLGRGLGALIPGAGSTPAPEQELRTRTRPASEDEEPAASNRPVDMFFSGEQASADDDRPQRERARRQDLASAMARDAAQRRGRGAPARSTPRGSTSTSSEDAETASAKDVAAVSTEAPEEPVKKTSTRTRSNRSTTGTSSTTRKSGPAKTSSAASAAAAAVPTETASTPADEVSAEKTPSTKTVKAPKAPKAVNASKSPSTTTPAPKASASKPTASTGTNSTSAAKPEAAPSKDSTSVSPEASKSAAVTALEDSPVVDVEAVEPAPAQSDSGEQESASAEPDIAIDSQSEAATAAEVDTEAAAGARSGTAADSGTKSDADAVVASTERTEPSLEAESPSGYARQDLVSVPGAEFAEIPIHEIRENPRNPRMMFDDDELDELAYSLREVGVLQPVVVRPIPVTEEGESFELVMGERRWRAARRAELTSIPAIIRETSDDDLLRDALLENLHRTQLNPLEEANAYQQLLEDFGCTQDELGERIGRSRPQITNTLRLLRLPALVQRRLASGALSAGHSRALLSLDDPTLMEELAQRIVSEGLSVRAVERLVASGGQQQTNTRPARRTTYDPHVVDLTSRLSNRLETPVRIDVGKRKGRITLEFTNLEDLDRLIEGMGLDAPPAESDGPSEE